MTATDEHEALQYERGALCAQSASGPDVVGDEVSVCMLSAAALASSTSALCSQWSRERAERRALTAPALTPAQTLAQDVRWAAFGKRSMHDPVTLLSIFLVCLPMLEQAAASPNALAKRRGSRSACPPSRSAVTIAALVPAAR
ncbi:MAG: hypothetical protein ACLQBX_19115 [Candidatus Limnocylindrales bacterium]